VAPDGANFLSADRLPDILTIFNILPGKQDNSLGSYYLRRYRRSFTIYFPNLEQKKLKPEYDSGKETDSRMVKMLTISNHFGALL